MTKHSDSAGATIKWYPTGDSLEYYGRNKMKPEENRLRTRVI